MRLLLDTQILIYLVDDRGLLTRREKGAIGGADELLISAVSLFELRVKRRAERRRGLAPSVISPGDAIAFCEAKNIAIHPLIAEDTIVDLLEDTPHGDPFDEMLVGHAQVLQARLLTRDKKLRHHPVACQA